MEPMDETTIMFGNGEETTSGTKAFLGNLEAIVCNDNQLTDDFIAIHRIVDAGFDIHLNEQEYRWRVHPYSEKWEKVACGPRRP
jgi:hypothetical protein